MRQAHPPAHRDNANAANLLTSKVEVMHKLQGDGKPKLTYIINLEVFPLSNSWLCGSERTVGVRGRNLAGNVLVVQCGGYANASWFSVSMNAPRLFCNGF